MNPDVDDGFVGDLELGMMVNLGRRSAAGVAVLLGDDEVHQRSGISARYRHWLNGRWSAEVSVGALSVCDYQGPGAGCDRARLGFVAQAAANLGDLVALSVAYEQLNAGSGTDWYTPRESQVHVGLRFGSYIGAPLAILSIVAGRRGGPGPGGT